MIKFKIVKDGKNMDIKELSIEEKIGQMFIVGLEDKKQEEINKLIKEMKSYKECL